MKGRRAARGVEVGGRLGGAKRQHRNKFGVPWQESCGKLRGGGDWGRASNSRSQREVVFQIGKSECWDGYGRLPVGIITSCCRRIYW